MNERQQKIQTIISENGEAKLSELERIFPETSSMTLRRDLDKLETMGEIVRTRGGAKSIAYLSRLKEALYSVRDDENTAEKIHISKIAYSQITQGSSLFLDSGTTVSRLAKLITDDKLFVVTASPYIALECAKKTNVTVFVTGGRLSRGNLSLSGVNALGFLDNINIDVAYMASSGFTIKSGFTCGNFDECQMKKKVVEKAARVVMLMDSTKFGKSLPFTFASRQDIDLLITDENIGGEVSEQLETYGIEVKCK